MRSVCDLFATHPQIGEELTLRVVIPAEGDRAEWSDGTETGEMFFSGFSGSIMLQELVGYDTLDTLLIGTGDGQTWARYRRGVNRSEMKIDGIWIGECLRQIN